MPTLYHIHPTTGTPALCRAVQGRCPFGSAHEHYGSKEEARQGYEASMREELLPSAPHNPQVTAFVDALFTHHIRKVVDPDVRALLERTQAELSTTSSPTKLNRIAALYYAAAMELDDDSEENLAEASDMVATTAEYLLRYYGDYKVFSRYGGDERYSRQLAESLQEVKYQLSLLKQRDLNLELIEDPEAEGTVLTEGHTVVLRKATAATVGEVLRAAPDDAIYYGRAREAVMSEAKKEITARAEQLVAAYSTGGLFMPPEEGRDGSENLPDDFYYLASGAESNVYVHLPTSTVYKLPHKDSYSVVNMENVDLDSFRGRRNALNAVVLRTEAAYGRVDKERLAAEHDAEYLPTYFLTLKDEQAIPVGVIVQPYLDEVRYLKYTPMAEERYEVAPEIGVNDLHGGNLRLDRNTGRLVLFDCLLDL